MLLSSVSVADFAREKRNYCLCYNYGLEINLQKTEAVKFSPGR